VFARRFYPVPMLGLLLFAVSAPVGVWAQIPIDPTRTPSPPSQPDDMTKAADAAPPSSTVQAERAARQLREQERQRILGLIPNFNTSNDQNAAPLSREQKFHLALRSAVDPVQVLGAGILAGVSQARNDFPGYGQGSRGYLKSLGRDMRIASMALYSGTQYFRHSCIRIRGIFAKGPAASWGAFSMRSRQR